MGCPLNKQHFMFIPYEGSHNFQPEHISYIGNNYYEIAEECKLCKEHRSNIRLRAELLRMGISLEQLEKVNRNRLGIWWYKLRE